MDGEKTEIDQDVAAGSSGDISVSLIAPDSEGIYTGFGSHGDSTVEPSACASGSWL